MAGLSASKNDYENENEIRAPAGSMLKKVLISFGICIAAVPAAAIASFLLFPFWRWFEGMTQIESIGHSGPADWCFVAIYCLILLSSFGVWFLSRNKDPTKISP